MRCQIRASQQIDDAANAPAQQKSTHSSQKANASRFPQENAEDIVIGGADGFHDPDLTGAFQNRHRHGIGNPNGSHQQSNRPYPAKHNLHDGEKAVDALHLGLRGVRLEAHIGDLLRQVDHHLRAGGFNSHVVIALLTVIHAPAGDPIVQLGHIIPIHIHVVIRFATRLFQYTHHLQAHAFTRLCAIAVPLDKVNLQRLTH